MPSQWLNNGFDTRATLRLISVRCKSGAPPGYVNSGTRGRRLDEYATRRQCQAQIDLDAAMTIGMMHSVRGSTRDCRYSEDM